MSRLARANQIACRDRLGDAHFGPVPPRRLRPAAPAWPATTSIIDSDHARALLLDAYWGHDRWRGCSARTGAVWLSVPRGRQSGRDRRAPQSSRARSGSP
jgi:hypothetical protein